MLVSLGSSFSNAESWFDSGPLIYFYAFGRNILVVNDSQIAEEFLDRRGALYSRRPTWSMVFLTGRQHDIVFMEDNERHRKSRAILQSALNPLNQKTWGPILESETEKLMYEILKAPEAYPLHIKKSVLILSLTNVLNILKLIRTIHCTICRYLAHFVTRLSYGVEKVDDEYIHLADVVSDHFHQALNPGRWIVDSIPQRSFPRISNLILFRIDF